MGYTFQFKEKVRKRNYVKLWFVAITSNMSYYFLNFLLKYECSIYSDIWGLFH